jgi:NADH dehydrogenase
MIVHRLLERGERVRALVREGSDHAALAEAGAEIVFGDLKAPATLQAAVDGVDTVVSTATASHRGGEDTIETVDRRGTAALIDAAREAGVGRFVFVSAHGFEIDSEVDIARAKAENEARLRESGIPYTILRPVAFMDVWIGFVLGAQLQQGPRIVIMGDGEHRMGYVAARDLADLAAAVVGDDGAANATIPFAGDVASVRQVVDRIEKATGQPIEIVSLSPGEEIPGLPSIVSQLMVLLDHTEPPARDRALLERYRMTPVTLDDFVKSAFGSQESR